MNSLHLLPLSTLTSNYEIKIPIVHIDQHNWEAIKDGLSSLQSLSSTKSLNIDKLKFSSDNKSLTIKNTTKNPKHQKLIPITAKIGL